MPLLLAALLGSLGALLAIDRAGALWTAPATGVWRPSASARVPSSPRRPPASALDPAEGNGLGSRSLRVRPVLHLDPAFSAAIGSLPPAAATAAPRPAWSSTAGAAASLWLLAVTWATYWARGAAGHFRASLAAAATPLDSSDESQALQETSPRDTIRLERAEPMVISMCTYYGQRKPKRVGFLGKAVTYVTSLHPAVLVACINIITTFCLWRIPALVPVFMANGLLNPLGLLLSGFACINPVALVNEVFFYYVVTRAYVSWWTRTEFFLLYIGGTIGGALVGALNGTAYMGPTAGSAALMAAFFVRNQYHPTKVWPFINLQMPMRTVAIIVGLLDIWLLVDGSAKAAAFLGGTLFAVLQWQYEKRMRPSNRYRR